MNYKASAELLEKKNCQTPQLADFSEAKDTDIWGNEITVYLCSSCLKKCRTREKEELQEVANLFNM